MWIINDRIIWLFEWISLVAWYSHFRHQQCVFVDSVYEEASIWIHSGEIVRK